MDFEKRSRPRDGLRSGPSIPGQSFQPSNLVRAATIEAQASEAHHTGAGQSLFSQVVGNESRRPSSRPNLAQTLSRQGSFADEYIEGNAATDAEVAGITGIHNSFLSVVVPESRCASEFRSASGSRGRADSAGAPVGRASRLSSGLDDGVDDNDPDGWHECENGLRGLPSDWTLKTAVRFESTLPFEWSIGNRSLHSPMFRALGLVEAASGIDWAGSDTNPSSKRRRVEGNRPVDFSAAVACFQHPGTTVPDEMMSALAKMPGTTRHSQREAMHTEYGFKGLRRQPANVDRPVSGTSKTLLGGATIGVVDDNDENAANSVAGFAYRRRSEWARAFRSVFQLLRAGECPYFFARFDVFVVLFVGAGVLERAPGSAPPQQVTVSSAAAPRSPVCAVVSRSNRALRNELRTMGVAFGTPLEPALVTADQHDSDEVLNELRRYKDDAEGSMVNAARTKVLKRSSSYSEDELASPSSLITVAGELGVRGLHSLLLNRVVRRGGTSNADVPLVLSPTPFESATISHASVGRPGVGAKASGACKEVRSYMRCTGFMLPSGVTRLLGAVHHEHQLSASKANVRGGSSASEDRVVIEARFKTHDHTMHFNRALRAVVEAHECDAYHDVTFDDAPVRSVRTSGSLNAPLAVACAMHTT